MDFTEIMGYLEQGFTLAQIKEMQTKDTANQQAKADPKQPEPSQPEPKTDDTPAWAETLNKTIETLTRTMQAQALAGTNISAPKDIQTQADEILANIINPTKGDGK